MPTPSVPRRAGPVLLQLLLLGWAADVAVSSTTTPPLALLEAGGAAAAIVPTTLTASGSLPSLTPLVSGAAAEAEFLVLAAPSTGELLFLSTPTPALVCSATVPAANASNPWIGVAVTSAGEVVTATAAGATTVWAVAVDTADGARHGAGSRHVFAAAKCTATPVASLPATAAPGQAFVAFASHAVNGLGSNNGSSSSSDFLLFTADGATAGDPATTTAFSLAVPSTPVSATAPPTFALLWQNRSLDGTSGLHLAATATNYFPDGVGQCHRAAAATPVGGAVAAAALAGGDGLVASASLDGRVFLHALNGSLVTSTSVNVPDVVGVVVLDTLGNGQQTVVVVSRRSSAPPTSDSSVPPSRAVALWLNSSQALQVVGPPLALDDVAGSEWHAVTTASVYAPVPSSSPPRQHQQQQLVGLRNYSVAVSGSAFPVNVLVYGDGRVLARRRRAVEGSLGQQGLTGTLNVTVGDAGEINTTALLALYAATGSNTHNFELCSKAHYVALLSVLQATVGVYVNRAPLRVWVELLPPTEAVGDACAPPDDSPLTPFNETAFFAANASDYLNYEAWGALLGALAALPFAGHLTAINMDDMSHDIAPPSGIFAPERVAGMLGNLRRRAPWVNFAPTIYYSEGTPVFEAWPDLSLTLDAPLFYFRNQKRGAGPCAPAACPWGPHATEHVGGCLAGSCSESTAWNVADEVADIRAWLPPGRRPLVGFYATGHSSLGSPTARYVASVLSALGSVDALGIMVYTFVAPGEGDYCGPDPPGDWEVELFAKGCAVRDAFAAMSGGTGGGGGGGSAW